MYYTLCDNSTFSKTRPNLQVPGVTLGMELYVHSYLLNDSFRMPSMGFSTLCPSEFYLWILIPIIYSNYFVIFITDKLTIAQLVKIFPAFYANLKCIIVLK
jgi:hypothetical protein